MKRSGKIAIAIGAAVTLGLAAAVSAQPYGYGEGPGEGYGPGYGMAQGYGMGPGWGMHGYGMGPGRGMHGYGMGPGYGRGPGWGMHGYGRGPGAMFGGGFGNVDARLDAMKSQLGITAKQEGAWKAFAKHAKQQSEKRQALFEKMQKARGAGTTPEFVEQRAELMKERAADLESNAKAMKSLYAALSPEQKEMLDRGFGGGYGPGNCLQGYGGRGARFR